MNIKEIKTLVEKKGAKLESIVVSKKTWSDDSSMELVTAITDKGYYKVHYVGGYIGGNWRSYKLSKRLSIEKITNKNGKILTTAGNYSELLFREVFEYKIEILEIYKGE